MDKKFTWTNRGIVLFLLLLTIFITLKGYMPKRYNLAVGDICPVDVYASGIITDKDATETAQENARNYVQPQYDYDLDASARAENKLTQTLDAIEQHRDTPGSIDDRITAYTGGAGGTLAEDILSTVFNLTDEEFAQFRKISADVMKKTMQNGVEADHLESAYIFIRDKLYLENVSQRLRDAAYALLVGLVEPNKQYNEQATEAAREEAAAKVEPVVYQKGEKIVGRGERLSQNQYDMMVEMGYINDKKGANIANYAGLILLVVILVLFNGFILYKAEKELFYSTKNLMALSGIYTVLLLIIFFLSTQPAIPIYVAPIIALPIMTVILFDVKVAVITNALLCIIASVALHGDFEFLLCNFFGGTFVALYLTRVRSRTQILIATLIAAVAEFSVVFSFGIIENSAITVALLHGSYIVLGVLISGVFATGLLPVWESVFHIVTPFRLIEYTNSDHPLLKRLLLEASGTYHHSLMVGNLAENAARAVEANPLLARVGAYYHDVGKLKQPLMFKENQYADNPHDLMSPHESAKIIISHAADGVKIAREYNMPQVIIDYILQHHGTTAAMYFYQKARAKDPDTDIADFRYAGPKPRTKEAGIIMLADTVEAAVRSMDEHSQESLEPFIGRLIKQKVEDGQLDDCDITFRELKIIRQSFLYSLKGYFHQRVRYPQIEDKEEG